MEKLRGFLWAYIITLGLLAYLSSAADVHPYGFSHSYNEQENVTVVKKGIINTESYSIPLEGNTNDLLRLLSNINILISNWLVYIFVLSIFGAGILGFFKGELRWNLKLSTYSIIYALSLFIVIVVGILFFNNQASDIMNILNNFTNT